MSELFQRLVEQAPDGVVILDAGRIVFINATAARLLGGTVESALDQPITSFLPPADAAATVERITRMMRTGEPMPPNEYGVLADPARTVEIKSMRWEWEGRPAVLAFARDVTERKTMHQHIVRADRLAAVGTLAAGVAHEINNPLTYVQLSLQLVENALAQPISEDLAECLRDAHHGIERIAAITRSLRMFARSDDAHAQPTDPVGVLDRALKMVNNDLRHRARLERRIAEVPWVVANPSRLEQVLVNLLLNAIQSLSGRSDDMITVEIAPHGNEVALRIRDTGCGMSASVCERVFDPFFTTKPVGEGMGLGLAISKSIVDSVGGRLVIESIEGTGTAATVFLRAHAAPQPTVETGDAAKAGSRGRVLVIDDEHRVRALLATLLSEHHDVTNVPDGETALAHTRDHAYDVILCDVMMPGMSGVDVHKRIASQCPGLERKIVFITGGTFMPGIGEAIAQTGNRVVNKPFEIAEILAVIASTIAV